MKLTILKKWMVTLPIICLYFNIGIQATEEENPREAMKKDREAKKVMYWEKTGGDDFDLKNKTSKIEEDMENTGKNEISPHTPPTWFANLDQEDQNKMVELLSQALNQYGSFGRDVKQDLIEKFQIKDFQAEELYKFVYHSLTPTQDLKPTGKIVSKMTRDETNKFLLCNLARSAYLTEQLKKYPVQYSEDLILKRYLDRMITDVMEKITQDKIQEQKQLKKQKLATTSGTEKKSLFSCCCPSKKETITYKKK